ncbi:MAG: purine-nucleoside phosphorylase [Pseudomonadota bacterium]
MHPAVETLIKRLEGRSPRTAMILGSGLGDLADTIEDEVSIPYDDLPGFPVGNVTGHARRVVAGTIAGKPIMMLSGRVHYYEHGDAAAMRPVLQTLSDIGIENLVLTNAAGSVDLDIEPGSVMQISDHINWSGMNPLMGEETDARFVDLSEVYDRGLLSLFSSAAETANVPMGKGIYMWFSGPTFETPAEIRMSQTLGANAVGMSTVPEAILARFYGLRVAGFSVITNMGAGMQSTTLSHDETKQMAPVGGEKLAKILTQAISGGGL